MFNPGLDMAGRIISCLVSRIHFAIYFLDCWCIMQQQAVAISSRNGQGSRGALV